MQSIFNIYTQQILMGCDSFCYVVRQVEDISIVWGGSFSIAIGSVCRRGINQAYSFFPFCHFYNMGGSIY
jgi:hypothetical protein